MNLKSNSTEDEKESPFYKINKDFATEFEHFILEKNGTVKGNYNVWSYTLFGKIATPNNWILKYKKATFSLANLLLSTKYQNLLVLAEWQTKMIGTGNSDFIIRKKTKTDFIKLWFSSRVSKFNVYHKYIIKSQNNTSELISKLTKILAPLFESKEIYSVEHRHNKLSIELRTDKHHFEIFNKLTKL
ncbi:hypothetical protein [Lacinutrix undariae]